MEPALPCRRINPYGCRAAADFRAVGLQRVRHGLELAAEVDQQPIAVFAVEQLEFFVDFTEWWQGHPSQIVPGPAGVTAL